MKFSIKESQRENIQHMITHYSPLNEQDSEYTWKIIIFDHHCQKIIAPLFTLHELRRLGVTLTLPIKIDRENVPDVPVIYFVQPNEENVQLISRDFGRGLYDEYYINFSACVDAKLLEELARSAVVSNCAEDIGRVYDQYLDFVSLEHNLFSLEIDDSYLKYHSEKVLEEDAISYIEQCVNGLFSVIITLGKIPIIRCPDKGNCARMIASRLDQKIREYLESEGSLFSSDMSSSYQRPLLVILDRDIDMSVMLSHPWIYQALVHDLLGMDNNRVDVPDDSGKTTHYNFDSRDKFWEEHSGNHFPQVAADLNKKVEGIEKRIGSKNDDNEDTVEQIHELISSLPELQEKQYQLHAHTNIAFSLIDIINQRSINEYFELEDEIITQKKYDKEKVLDYLRGQHGTPDDAMRFFLVYFITHRISKEDIQEFEAILEERGADLSALRYLQNKKLGESWETHIIQAQDGRMTATFDKAKGFFSKMVDRVIKYTKKDYITTQIVDALMSLNNNVLDVEDYLYMDPKFPEGMAPKKTTPFKEGIVFTVGGGNYVEYQNLKENCAANKKDPQMDERKIIYGSTEMLTGEQFLRQLEQS